MDAYAPPLGDLTVEEFLQHYWQKKPLLIRNAFPDFIPPVDAEELAGLSLDEDVESRLIIENGESGPWELQCGPFDEDIYANLPLSHWTLLVQAVDQWIPDVADLRKYFRFLPDWRLDDVMISYATDGGGVGPHYDQYDVFLIQATGQRRWKLGQHATSSSPCLTETDLHILNEFHTTEDWLLSPGDMLYLPPQLAHWGVAEGDNCMTISMGYRAPSEAEVLTEFCQEVACELTEDHRYTDPQLTANMHPAAITPDVIEKLHQLLLSHLDDTEALGQWFGKMMTQPKYPELQPERDTLEADWSLSDWPNGSLVRALDARLAFIESPNGTVLFANGEALSCTSDFARYLCDIEEIENSDCLPFLAAELNRNTLKHLIENSIFYCCE